VAASLTDSAGNTLDLPLTPVSGSAAGSSLLGLSAALAFGSNYTLTASGADLAGNPASSAVQLATIPVPGLFAQDGFEGLIHATMTASVGVVESPAMPIPSGKRALLFTKLTRGSTVYSRFTARLSVLAGATAMKVTYVRVGADVPAAGIPGMPYGETHILWTVGIPNTTAVVAYDNLGSQIISEPRPWTVDPATQGATGSFFEPQTLTFPLPAPASSGEVLFDVFTDSFPPVGDSAFILDDLRVE
jgi:hypothetical protein